MAFILVLVALLVLPAHASAACEGPPLKTGAQTIAVGDAMRSFVVRVPSGYDGRTAAPVVFAFHPFGMNAQYMQVRVPVNRAWPEAIAVYPEGMAAPGRGAAPSWQGRAGDLDDRDVKFFDAMLSWLDGHSCIDRARVFALGYSNGAGLAYLLACERRDALAGVAIASGRLGCEPKRATPVIASHGVRDTTIGYDQAMAAMRRWTTVNACSAPPKAGIDGCQVASGCQDGTSVVLCTYNGGHEYNLPFTAAAMEFFKQQPASR